MENYKEKYEDALERARVWKEKSGMPVDKQGILDDIFPELKESDDEKIRKTLKSFFDSEISDYGNVEWRNGIRYGEIVSWLEKQGEQKQTLPKWKYKKDDTPLLRDSIIFNKYGCVAKSPSGALVSDVWTLDYDELKKLPKEEFEKQGGQKPAEWSEEDNLQLQAAIDVCKSSGHTTTSDWLKSLKERMKGE